MIMLILPTVWASETNNRTNELDANATVTSGNAVCVLCATKDTIIHFIPCRPNIPKAGDNGVKPRCEIFGRNYALTANHTEILTTDRPGIRTHSYTGIALDESNMPDMRNIKLRRTA